MTVGSIVFKLPYVNGFVILARIQACFNAFFFQPHFLCLMLEIMMRPREKLQKEKETSPTKLLSPEGCPYEYLFYYLIL